MLLAGAVPPGYELLSGPYDWRVDRFNVFVPALMILPVQKADAKRLEIPPLLGVEILSPSSRQRDLHLKKRAYESAGLGWYWIVDPDEPSLTVFRLVDERFVDDARVAGDETYRFTEPLEVAITPADLVQPAG